MSKKKILVTGGTGYIGSHTAIELIESGYEVVVIDDLSNSEEKSLDRVAEITGVRPSFYKIDICDKQGLSSVFDTIGKVDGIIHFAARKAVGESVEKPLLYYKVNVEGLLNVLAEMKNIGCHNLIFSSSCTVYGQPDVLPVYESTPRKPAESPYGNTKQIGEDILRDYCHTTDAFKCIALRYFNPVGAHPSGLIGELPQGVPANLMPYITQTAAGVREQLSVFGSDYNTSDGTAIRDYIHVSDLAKAHVAAMERLFDSTDGDNYEIFNIGTGQGSTVLEVIQSFEKTNSLTIPYQIVGRRAGDIETVYANVDKSTDVLGWTAQYNLDDMTRSAWKWEQYYRKNG